MGRRREDASADREFFVSHRAPSWRIAFAIVGNATIADDVIQETLSAIYAEFGAQPGGDFVIAVLEITPEGGAPPSTGTRWPTSRSTRSCSTHGAARSHRPPAPPPSHDHGWCLASPKAP